MKTMLKDITRSRLIQVWFVAILLVAAAGMAFGMSMTVSTAAMLLGQSRPTSSVSDWRSAPPRDALSSCPNPASQIQSRPSEQSPHALPGARA